MASNNTLNENIGSVVPTVLTFELPLRGIESDDDFIVKELRPLNLRREYASVYTWLHDLMFQAKDLECDCVRTIEPCSKGSQNGNDEQQKLLEELFAQMPAPITQLRTLIHTFPQWKQLVLNVEGLEPRKANPFSDSEAIDPFADTDTINPFSDPYTADNPFADPGPNAPQICKSGQQIYLYKLIVDFADMASDILNDCRELMIDGAFPPHSSTTSVDVQTLDAGQKKKRESALAWVAKADRFLGWGLRAYEAAILDPNAKYWGVAWSSCCA